jgi:uncharacterized repeat protein (TIGR01451 family)
MKARVRGLCLKLLLTAGLGLTGGCFGVSQNPSYFPYLLPTGDIIQTHAKPPGHGYYANFDPHAIRLEVRPLESTNPVRSQHVLIATVYDEKGVPRRDRRVEWMLEGVGNIIEVDESGFFPGRGYKVDNKYAVSYTAYHTHRITRGNADPNDDFEIRPGQTWCVLSSAVEGDTHVTVYAPEIANWDAHKVFVTKHWVDAEWQLPPPAVNRAGVEHVLTTNVFRHTDRQPLANYRVRYRILDGPPALFLPDRTQEFVALSDLSGHATAHLVQVTPQPGVNRIGIEIIRPPDAVSAGGVGIVIGSGETTKEWRGPQVALNLTGPPTAAVNQEVAYTITVTNNGAVESQAMTVRDGVPEGLQYVRSMPRASVEGNQLIWTLGVLPPGNAHTLQVVFQPTRVGPVTNTVLLTTVEGFRDEKSVTTQITAPQAPATAPPAAVPPATAPPAAVPQPAVPQAPQLNVALNGPDTATVAAPLTYQVVVTNPGTGPAVNVELTATFDKDLEHASKANTVTSPLGTLAPGETKTLPLVLTPRRAGKFTTRITATADGNLKSEAQRIVTVQEVRLTITKVGPKARYVNQTATWDITVANQGDLPLSNVVVRDQLAPELDFQSATQLGQLISGQVVWNLGNLGPREQKVVQLTARCLRLTPRVLNIAVATADPGLQETAEAALEIRGLPAFGMEVTKAGDPVVVGGKVMYTVAVTNTGTLPANEVQITAVVPRELKVAATNGPSQAQVDGGKVVFPPVDALGPKQTFTYTIETQALQPGDVRLRVELRNAAQAEPVIKETSTNIVPATNGNGAGPGGAANGARPIPPQQ